MMKIVASTLLLVTVLSAEHTITLKKGWQFIGFPSDINDISAFNSPDVDIVWGYDAQTQSWLGYAPEEEKQSKINANYKPLSKIEAWQGIWIHNNKQWRLTLAEQESTKHDISLSKGWNLVSLPNDMTISPTLFKDDIVWKYHDSTWQLSSNGAQTKKIAPPISKIESAEAIWIKSTHAHQVSLSSESSALHTFSSKEKMRDYIREMALDMEIPRYYDFIPTDMPYVEDSPSASETVFAQEKATDTTGTNLQEDDVDESDILKHNDEHIFFYNRANNSIQITNFTNLTNNQDSTFTPITLPSNINLSAMFLHDDKLIIITHPKRYYAQRSETTTELFAPKDASLSTYTLRMYDISNINAIQELSQTTIDGDFENSRIIGDSLYIVSQFSPFIKVEYPHIYIDEKSCKEEMIAYEAGHYTNTCAKYYHDSKGYYRYDYSKPNITKEKLIPTINNGQRDLIEPDAFYAPYKLNQFPTITTISHFDISTNRLTKSISIAAYTNKLYASSNNIYLSSSQYPDYWDFRNFKEREVIYKFSLGDDFNYQAKGFVEGEMLNQFSMSEKDGILRVASTSGSGWREDANNFVFTLAQEGTSLNIKGTLKDLGHKGERIRGVRFLGDRGYVVTFRQTDPFYTLDMSDPSNPRKVGELNATGFSSYIHPVDENYILTLGRDASSEGKVAGFKISLYDISDFAHPRKADEKIYSTSLYHFDAEYNHQAFIYRKSDKRFAITYHDKQTSEMDIFKIDAGHINQTYQLTLDTKINESRGIIFNMNSRIYSTLFNGDAITTKDIGVAQ